MIRLKLRSKVEELMNRDDSESVFCVSVILPNSKRIDCRLPDSASAKVVNCTVMAYTPSFYFNSVGSV